MPSSWAGRVPTFWKNLSFCSIPFVSFVQFNSFLWNNDQFQGFLSWTCSYFLKSFVLFHLFHSIHSVPLVPFHSFRSIRSICSCEIMIVPHERHPALELGIFLLVFKLFVLFWTFQWKNDWTKERHSALLLLWNCSC